MANGLRLTCMTVTIIVVALAAALVRPEWAGDLALKKWIGENVWSHSQGATDAEIDQCRRAVVQRSAAKRQITWDLIDGRLTLFEAAALFRRWNEEYPRLPDPSTPGDSIEERLCRQVIEWVRLELRERHPGAVDQFCASFEAELRRHKEQYGKVILPNVVKRGQLSN
jgi:hypothetical protein